MGNRGNKELRMVIGAKRLVRSSCGREWHAPGG